MSMMFLIGIASIIRRCISVIPRTRSIIRHCIVKTLHPLSIIQSPSPCSRRRSMNVLCWTNSLRPFPSPLLRKHTLLLLSPTLCARWPNWKTIWSHPQLTFCLALSTWNACFVGALVAPVCGVSGGAARWSSDFHIVTGTNHMWCICG